MYKHIKSKHRNFKSLKVYCQNRKLHKDTFLKYIVNDKQNKQKSLTKEKQRLLLSRTYSQINAEPNRCIEEYIGYTIHNLNLKETHSKMFGFGVEYSGENGMGNFLLIQKMEIFR